MTAVVSDQLPTRFADLLKRLRAEADLTQEALAERAGISARSISDLERGISQTARRDTTRLLADALNLVDAARISFEAAARGRLIEPDRLQGGALARSIAATTPKLPHDIRGFTGRRPDLARLVAEAIDEATVVKVYAIDGMAGVGKSAFAVHAAHALAHHFPDGQIFLRLHAHTVGQRPVEPTDALASLLLATGVPAQQIPEGLAEREGMWRAHLVGKRILLLLDDAAGHEQVRPLLPSTPGNLVLITSRKHLAALDEATSICLGTLPADEAATLLVRLAERTDIEEDDSAVADLNSLCGYLPLAIGMLARQLHHHPAWTVAWLASELAACRYRLELMHAENLSVTAAFDLSYQDLSDDQQRLFMRLGLYPGTDIDIYAATALDDTSISLVRQGLGTLFDHHLVSEPTSGRYRMHELIREHALAMALTGNPADNEAAINRVFDYYLYCLNRANRLMGSSLAIVPEAIERPKGSAPKLADTGQAIEWLEAERSSLLACAEFAVAQGWSVHATRLAAQLSSFLRTCGYWDDAATLHQSAAAVAQANGAKRDEAVALTNLGAIQYLTGKYEAATLSLTKGLSIQVALNDKPGHAEALNYLGLVQAMTDDYQGATTSLEQALTLHRELGDTLGQAEAMTRLGIVRRLTGNYSSATSILTEALELYRSQPDKQDDAATALVGLGVVQRLAADYPTAEATLTQALDIYQSTKDLVGQAEALNELGIIQRLTGDYAAARDSHEYALTLSRSQGDRLREADALRYLGSAQLETKDYPAIKNEYLTAISLYRELGDRLGEAHTLNYLGVLYRLTGSSVAAQNTLAEALQLYESLGHRLGQAEALNNLGDTALPGSLASARISYEQALTIARDIGALLEEGHALEGLAECALRSSEPVMGIAHLRQARQIYRQIGAARAISIERRLESTNG